MLYASRTWWTPLPCLCQHTKLPHGSGDVSELTVDETGVEVTHQLGNCLMSLLVLDLNLDIFSTRPNTTAAQRRLRCAFTLRLYAPPSAATPSTDTRHIR